MTRVHVDVLDEQGAQALGSRSFMSLDRVTIIFIGVEETREHDFTERQGI